MKLPVKARRQTISNQQDTGTLYLIVTNLFIVTFVLLRNQDRWFYFYLFSYLITSSNKCSVVRFVYREVIGSINTKNRVIPSNMMPLPQIIIELCKVSVKNILFNQLFAIQIKVIPIIYINKINCIACCVCRLCEYWHFGVCSFKNKIYLSAI